ncbi:MAG: PrsW family glutamic-type intramembrane protease [Caldilineales bacterium]|nr:PrsW family glutamic-type intramembrane protease [Caldilineales bacterium]
MSQTICCVCEKPIAGEVLRLGGRPYCAPCYARVTADRRGMWWASLVGAGVLLLFVLVVALIAGPAQPHLEGGALLAVSLILALVPAAIWLAIFYAQDVREPEPKPLVLGVFLLGALLAQAVGRPVTEGLFAVSRWMAAAGPLSHILAAILIVGFTEMFLVYAAVRFSVYGLSEFDERVDGVIYGTAAALGYATVLNVAFVVESGGVDPVAGTVRIAVTALALASFGGLLGYFLGRCKFEDEPLWWMPAGLALAAALNGLFIYLRGEVTTTAVGLQGGGYNPWPGLILAAVVAGVTFGVLFYLLSRLRRRLAAVSP